MVVILLTIVIIGLIAVIVYFQLDKDSDGQSINDVVASSWETKEITTNTSDNQFVRIQFQIQLDSKKAREEIEKRDFQVYDIIYHSLSDMKAEDFLSQEQFTQFEQSLINEINKILEDGQVIKIFTIQKIIQ